jgi:DNA polymerase I-like protein with 3'-5' exonuclease and polymerase domains
MVSRVFNKPNSIVWKYRDGLRGVLVQSVKDLPDFSDKKVMYLDFETTSFDIKKAAFYPYLGHRIAGIAVVFDDEKEGYYIPIRHTDADWNLPLEAVIAWLLAMLQTVPEWSNHNLVFDANFAFVETGFAYQGRMVDTIIAPKLINSDRMKYELKVLMVEWLGWRMSETDKIKEALKALKSKNYGDCPADWMGEYAVMDCFAARALREYSEPRIPEISRTLYEQEKLLTPVLFDITCRGVKIDKQKVKKELHRVLLRLIDLQLELTAFYGQEYIDYHTHLYEIIVNRLSLPVLDRDFKTKNAKFNGDILKQYAIHPEVLISEEKQRILSMIVEERKLSHYRALFLEPYLELSDIEHILHPEFNQNVRTGRMSCKRPNLQQSTSESRSFIIPRPGYLFFGIDGSQMEFRGIIHYVNDEEAVKAYNDDPKTDFHAWTGKQLGIKRRPSKVINFGLSFGAGQQTIQKGLASDPDVMEEVGEEINRLIANGEIRKDQRRYAYAKACKAKAAKIFTMYHERFPGIRTIAEYSKRMAIQRGYVFNCFGRMRHLIAKFARKAFNAIIQSFASDFVKNKMVLLSPRYNSKMRELDIHIVMQVHDEILFEIPIANATKEVFDYIESQLEILPAILDKRDGTPQTLRVPFHWDGGKSSESWAKAKA